MDRDMLWRWDQVLKTHPNGMRFSVFDEQGDLLATNEYFRYAPCGGVSADPDIRSVAASVAASS